MRLSSVILCLLFVFASVASASYLKNVDVKLKNPDGTTINSFMSGDENFHYYHDNNGYAIVQSERDGYYYYAKDDAGILVPSAQKASEKLTIFSEIAKNPTGSSSLKSQRSAKRYYNVSGNLTGPYTNISILIKFKDQTEFTIPRSTLEERFNSETEYSLKSYYKGVSYGKLDISTIILPKITDKSKNLSVTDKYERAFYEPYNIVTNTIGYKNDLEMSRRRDSLLYRAILAVKNEIPADMNLDLDDDYFVDNVAFIIRGTTSDWSGLLWPEKNGYAAAPRVMLGNAYLSTYTKHPEPRADVQTLCHEFFHVLGAPDLYHYDEKFYKPVGAWDLMGSGRGNPLAYMKWKVSKNFWYETIPEITTSGTYSIGLQSKSSTNTCYKITTPNSQYYQFYYMVEFRKKSGIDSDLPGSGLVIYRVKEKYEWGNAYPPDEVYVYRPGGSYYQPGNLNLSYFSKESGRTEFSKNSDTKPFFYNFSENPMMDDLRIYDIGSAEGETITFKVEINSTPTKIPQINVDNSLFNANFTSGTILNLSARIDGYDGYDQIENCSFYVDNTLVKSFDNSTYGVKEFATTYNTSSLSTGKHVVKITAKDWTENTATLTYDIYISLFSESFEALFPPVGWIATEEWSASTKLFKTGTTSAFATFKHTGEATLTSPKVRLSTPSYLEFYWANANYMTGKTRSDYKDSTTFEIYDGSKWFEVAKLAKSGIDKVYDKVIIDLTPYLNKDMQFRWRDFSNGDLTNIGTSIDAVSVVSYPSGKEAAYFNEPDAGAIIDQGKSIVLNAVCGNSSTKAVFYVNNTKIGEDSSAPYTITYNTSALPNGPYEFKAEFYNGSTLTASCVTSVVIQTATYVKFLDYSPNGYAWGAGSSKKISFEPVDNKLTSVYRKMFADSAQNTGSLAASYGTWDNLNQKTIVTQKNNNIGSRYLTTFSIPGYHFAVAPYVNVGGDVYFNGYPILSVYNSTSNSWSDTIVIKNGQKKLPNTYFGSGDAVKDANGKIHLLTAWFSGGAYRNIAFISGETNGQDPLKAQNWTFSNHEDNFLPVTTAFMESSLPKIALSNSGFGIAMARVAPLSSANNFAIGYCYTENFGGTMIYNQTNQGKYFIIDNLALFSWLNKTAGGLKIDQLLFGYDYDMLINSSGEVHFIIKVTGKNRQTGKTIQKLDDGTPVSGIYDIVGKNSGSSFTWVANFIAYNVGWSANDEVNPNVSEKLESSGAKCQIGAAGNILYATWLDRPHKNTVSCNFYDHLSEYGYSYQADAYFSYSSDGGKTWKFDPLYPGEKCGVNITGTSAVTEDGFSVSSKGVFSSNKLDFYAAYQYAILGMPLYPTNYLIDHRAKLYLRKYTIDLANMRAVYSDINNSSQISNMELFNNYPNPFNPVTNIVYKLAKTDKVSLTIFNVKGEIVTTLVDHVQPVGSHTVKFDGSRFNSGVYFYRLECGSESEVKKMILIK